MAVSGMLLVLVAVVLFVTLPALSLGETFDPGRTHFIDTVKSSSGTPNYIFRGNMPRAPNNTYDYWQLLETIRAKGKSEGNVSIPANIYIVEISFLFLEVVDDYLSSQFWKANPDKGRFVNWPLFGDLWGPDDFTDDLRQELAETLNDWQLPDQLPDKMARIRTILQAPGPNQRSVAVYVHCEAGEDRTGEFSGSYYMKWLNWSYQKALYFDDHVEHRDIMWASKNAMQWYCWYLYYVEKVPLLCKK